MILNNRIYCGEVEYRGERYVGEHPAIIDQRSWEQAHRQLLEKRPGIGRKAIGSKGDAFAGLLYCAHCAVRLFPTYATKAGRRYRYYACLRAQQRGWKKQIPNLLRELEAIIPSKSEVVKRRKAS